MVDVGPDRDQRSIRSRHGHARGRSPDHESHYDEYTLRLEAGQRYILKVESSAFDPVARLYRSGESDVLIENDDSDGLNSRIFYVPTETGNYTLRVIPLAADGTGAYRASAEIAPPLPAPLTNFTSMRTTVWKVYTGALTASDGQSASGTAVDDYLIHFNAGQERIIALDAPDFDTVVQVRAVDGRDGEDTLASNDDGGNSLNSLLRFKAETAGDYIVRVTALAANGRGAYTLRVSE